MRAESLPGLSQQYRGAGLRGTCSTQSLEFVPTVFPTGRADSCVLRVGLAPHCLRLPPPLQINIVILVAVTRVISRISTDNYKIHGDPSAFK